jgi:hypothetical protein
MLSPLLSRTFVLLKMLTNHPLARLWQRSTFPQRKMNSSGLIVKSWERRDVPEACSSTAILSDAASHPAACVTLWRLQCAKDGGLLTERSESPTNGEGRPQQFASLDPSSSSVATSHGRDNV